MPSKRAKSNKNCRHHNAVERGCLPGDGNDGESTGEVGVPGHSSTSGCTATPLTMVDGHDELVDQVELAHRIGVHPRTVRRLVARGELPRPCMGTSGRPRWLWSYVIEYCRRRHHQEAQLDKRTRRKMA